MKSLNKYLLGLLWAGVLMVHTVYGVTTSRPIFIGDIIELEIDSTSHSKESIQEAFSAFEIIALEELEEIYSIKIRAFQPGDYLIELGNEEILIQIESTLDEAIAEGIIDSDYNLIDVRNFSWEMALFISIIALGFSLIWSINAILAKRKREPLSPKEGFKASLNAIDLEDSGYIWQLTIAFKSYLYYGLKYPVLGMTTGELIHQLMDQNIPESVVKVCEGLLKECDELKYTGYQADENDKISLKDRFILLVDTMEQEAEVIT